MHTHGITTLTLISHMKETRPRRSCSSRRSRGLNLGCWVLARAPRSHQILSLECCPLHPTLCPLVRPAKDFSPFQ